MKFYPSEIWKIILNLELPIPHFWENKFEIACFRKKCFRNAFPTSCLWHFLVHYYWKQLKYQIKQIKKSITKSNAHYWNYRRVTDESQTSHRRLQTCQGRLQTTTDGSQKTTDESQRSHKQVTGESQRTTDKSQMSHKRVTDDYKRGTVDSQANHRQLQTSHRWVTYESQTTTNECRRATDFYRHLELQSRIFSH